MNKMVVAIVVVLFWLIPSHAANECTETSMIRGWLDDSSVSTVQVTIDCFAGAAASTFDPITINASGMITSFVFMPGTTTPTNLMDMTITDSDGFDLLMLQGMDLDTSTNTKKTPIDSDGKYFPAEFQESFIITLTNNSVNAATLKIKVNIIP